MTALAYGELDGASILLSGSENGVVSVRTPDGDQAVSVTLDARVEGFLPSGDRIAIATNRGIVTIQIQSSFLHTGPNSTGPNSART